MAEPSRTATLRYDEVAVGDELPTLEVPLTPSVIIAEGLLMYLSPAAVGDLFRQSAEATGPGSRLAFTYLGTRRDGRPDAGPWPWLWLRSLAAGGEPWLWSTSPEEIGPFLGAHGWTIDRGQTIGSARKGIEFFGLAAR